MSRSLRPLLAALLLLLALTVAVAGPASATPPNIPSEATARSELSSLRVAADGSSSGYSRDLFPHWNTVSGACNTRETVLKRDGSGVVTDSSCAATSGSWYSPYDGATWSQASDVDIDHMVPLAAAWRTGASSWTTTRRAQFANDLTNPQLIAVTDNVHQYAVRDGFHVAGVWSPLDWFTLSVTAMSCGLVRSLAKDCRWAVVQPLAPDFHASESGTMWSMSTSAAADQVAPSYSEYQLPLVAEQLELCTTLVPSRLSTVSRVSQAPDWVIQCGNLSRL